MTTPEIGWIVFAFASGGTACVSLVEYLSRPGPRTAEAAALHRGHLGGIASAKSRFRCGGCGLESNGGGLAQHQKHTGHTGKTRVGG
jgi:hypothetical protein